MCTVDPTAPISPSDIMAVIRRIMEEGNICSSQHINQRMRARIFTMQDVLNVFEHGHAKIPAYWNSAYHNWEYDIEGADIEGDSLTIRVAIDRGQQVITLITGF
jgi:hypothetical protein